MWLNNIKSIPVKVLRRIYAWNDYRLYARSLTPYCRITKNLPIGKKDSLLIVSGRGMNVLWAQIWTVMSLAVRIHGYRGLVLTTRKQRHLNRYYKLLGLDLVFFDDLLKHTTSRLPEELATKVANASTFDEIRDIAYKHAPVGQIALSTYSRYHGTGVVDVSDKKVANFVKDWIALICQSTRIAEKIYDEYNVRYLFFTEVFMEEYGAFYYAAINRGLNITRFAGTVRDNAIIVQHLTKANDRIHHASLSPSSWEYVKKLPFTAEMDKDLTQNFLDRYGDKWHRSKRNHPNTKIMPVEEARKLLNIAPGRKVAVIFSHILYDTLFFFGTDLFSDYAQWLVETVRVACQNPHIDWLIKVHPSNLWRGELNSLLKGRYEEERLLMEAFGELPKHVRVVSANTKINPYTWFQLADYGITVRGTSGLEMAALGKTVITAGTGRYEGNGFTIDPPDKQAYLKILKDLPDIPSFTSEQIGLAKRYAYSIFLLKPFTLASLVPRLKTGKREVRASDDIIYCAAEISGNELPTDLKRFSDWVVNQSDADLLATEKLMFAN
jgi:hypothetical protein